MPNDPRGLGPGGAPDTRNMILAIVLSGLILFGYEYFFAKPQRDRAAEAQRAQKQAQAEQIEKAPQVPVLDREGAIAASARVKFDNPAIDGSIALIGARLDDLSLKRYRQTVKKDSPEVTLLSPQGAKGGYDSYLGWEDPYTGDDVVGARTPWTAPEGAKLTPQTPLTLSYASPDGLVFTRTISLDDEYMFTVKDTVQNTSAVKRALHPISVVRRQDMPADFVPNQIVHQGMLGVFSAQHSFFDETYQAAKKHAQEKTKGKKKIDEALMTQEGAGGWLGIGDHYWLTALIPPQSEQIKGTFDATPKDNYIDYRASYTGATRQVQPGQKFEYSQQIFAGAKRVSVLEGYQKTLGIPDFDKAVDWGMFFFMTRPFFWVLDHLGQLVGNFGIAILLATIIVKVLLFPLVNSSFQAMAKLRKVQPKMKEIQERYAENKELQQKEMMKLYQQEKINPISGCLPILAQIPIFYALYKTLSVTIEMRHAPFFGWIHDLSARDPTTIFNLFGLLPFDPTTLPIVGGFLWLGALPIMYGLSMWATQSLSPPATDPVQAQIFKLMPIIFTFMFSSFAAGLVIYWTWSNTLSFVQQYIMMRRNGVETEIDKFFAKYFGKKSETPA